MLTASSACFRQEPTPSWPAVDGVGSDSPLHTKSDSDQLHRIADSSVRIRVYPQVQPDHRPGSPAHAGIDRDRWSRTPPSPRRFPRTRGDRPAFDARWTRRKTDSARRTGDSAKESGRNRRKTRTKTERRPDRPARQAAARNPHPAARRPHGRPGLRNRPELRMAPPKAKSPARERMAFGQATTQSPENGPKRTHLENERRSTSRMSGDRPTAAHITATAPDGLPLPAREQTRKPRSGKAFHGDAMTGRQLLQAGKPEPQRKAALDERSRHA